MKNITQTIGKQLFILTTAFTIALLANITFGQWSEPTATPPANNTAAPLNVGSDPQVKTGTIDLDGLMVTGVTPWIYLHDTDGLDTRITSAASGLGMTIQYNVSDNPLAPVWVDGLGLDYDTANSLAYAKFPNQVRAVEYCDQDGVDCDIATNIINRVSEVEVLRNELDILNSRLDISVGDVPPGYVEKTANFNEDKYPGFGGDTQTYIADTCNGNVNTSYVCPVSAEKVCVDSKTYTKAGPKGQITYYQKRTVECYKATHLVKLGDTGLSTQTYAKSTIYSDYPPPAAGAIAADELTMTKICNDYGWDGVYSYTTTSYDSPGDNYVMRWNGTEWITQGAKSYNSMINNLTCYSIN